MTGVQTCALPISFQHLAAGETMTVTVNYSITDGIAPVVAASATFTVLGTNDAPVVSGPATFSVQEDFGIQSVAPVGGEIEIEVETAELESHDLAEKDGAGAGSLPNSINLLANASDVDHGAKLSIVDLPSELPPGISYVHVDPVTTTTGYYGASVTTPAVDAQIGRAHV